MRIGLFGGTFSPPHNGHVNTAKHFIEKAKLDILYVMPDGEPPHKEEDKWGSKTVRYEMALCAFSGFSAVSDYEVSKPGKSYTVETLEYLKGLHPTDSIYLLMGDDMFLSFDRWREPERISSLATLVYASRGKDYGILLEKSREYRERFKTESFSLDIPPLEISSSEIRKKVAAGESISDLVPEKVEKYITEHQLYQ